ncbi:MAG: helix-turn-helix domain-containing protein [Alsobacter sp.]
MDPPETPSGDGSILAKCRLFSTRVMRPLDQFEAWRGHLSGVVELTPADEPLLEFPAEAEQWSLGNVTLSRFSLRDAPARAWRHRPESHCDDWCVVAAWPADGSARATVSFRSLALPFEGLGRDGEVLTLMLPRSGPARDSRDFDAAHDRVLAPPMAQLLADYMSGLSRNLSTMTQEQADALSEPTRLLVAACLAPRTDRIRSAEAPLSALMLERARQAVRDSMAVPEFGPTQLGQLLAVSRSKLYRLFEPSGGVTAFIQRERLNHAMARLSDPADMRSVNVIALSTGFADHSTFSRAFRREFGVSPSEAREIALVHQPTPRFGQPEPGLVQRPAVRLLAPSRTA